MFGSQINRLEKELSNLEISKVKEIGRTAIALNELVPSDKKYKYFCDITADIIIATVRVLRRRNKCVNLKK